ncbi:hypothetical protein NOV72_05744 [Caballeronia novacaledonica]|uniref:DNA primase n=2 Tax=Caballeronia novacaledonica TaxID=1544861 RepID=A0A2U3IEB6_9BURK|nr:hypothetical protein NOV72_05744 [Caballeronia novacaledonica]
MSLLARLEGVRQVAPGRWRAMCPAHAGHRPALAISECADGTVLMHCFGGCGVAEIAAALEMNLADLFPKDWRDDGDAPDMHRVRRMKHAFIPAQMLPALSIDLLEVAIIIGAILRRGSVTESEYARLLRSLARILDAEKYCHD